MPSMMTDKQKEQFEKFKGFTGWMYGDSELALYLAQAQFLVALGLFNYIETLGAFRKGFFEKDVNGNIEQHVKKGKKRCRGCLNCVNGKKKTSSKSRFKEFFSYLGPEYKSLSDTHEEIYKELRCGLSHEFLPSGRPFVLYHLGSETFTKEQVSEHHPIVNICADNLENNLDGSRVNCGVVLFQNHGREIWQVFVPKLAADFRRGVKRFIREIENDQSLHQNFFETANQINMDNFKI